MTPKARTLMTKPPFRPAQLALLRQFVAWFTHKLNNPLSIALGHSEELLHALRSPDPDPAAIREMSAYVHEACVRMLGLSRQLSVIVESSQDQETLVPRSLGELVHEALRTSKSILDRLRIEVRVDVPVTLPLVLCEPHQIEQLVANLVRNAAEAMDRAGTERPSIEILGELVDGGPDGRRIELTVHDNGPGIPPESRDRIFRPFFSTKGSNLGSGLGLSIALLTAQRHGGALALEDSREDGATFVLTLPAAEAAASRDPFEEAA